MSQGQLDFEGQRCWGYVFHHRGGFHDSGAGDVSLLLASIFLFTLAIGVHHAVMHN